MMIVSWDVGGNSDQHGDTEDVVRYYHHHLIFILVINMMMITIVIITIIMIIMRLVVGQVWRLSGFISQWPLLISLSPRHHHHQHRHYHVDHHHHHDQLYDCHDSQDDADPRS